MEPSAQPPDPARHRRGGRPLKPDTERLDSFIRFRVKADQREAIAARAASSGLSVADYSRAALDGNPVTVIVSQTAPPEVIQQLRMMGINLRQGVVGVQSGCFTDPAIAAAVAAALLEASQTVSAELRTVMHGSEP